MAYCVRCGVKLDSGCSTCPLCNTEVIAPKEVIGEKGNTPLFPANDQHMKIDHPLLDKKRKGYIELVIAFMSIAIITLIITAFALNFSFNPILPIGCVLIGGGYLLVLLFSTPKYTKIASWYVALTILLVLFIDMQDMRLSWSLYVISSLLLYWSIGVQPWFSPKKRRTYGYGGAVVAIGVFLFVLDILEGQEVQWFFPIALPTYLIFIASLVLVVLRIRFGSPTVTDIILSLIFSVCLAVVAGDFFSLRFTGSSTLLSWSSSVFVVSICLALFLALTASIRKVRYYFRNKIS